MSPAAWQGLRISSTWLLCMGLVCYALLIVGVRYPDAVPPPEPYELSSEMAYWIVIAALTLLPLGYAFVMIWRGLFLPALIVALYATFELFLVPARDGGMIDWFYGHENRVGIVAVRALLLVALWSTTLWFAFVGGADRAWARRRQDVRMVAVMLLAYGVSTLAAFWSVLAAPEWDVGKWLFSQAVLVGAIWTASRIVKRGDATAARPLSSTRAALGFGALAGLLAAAIAVSLHAWRRGAWLPSLAILPEGSGFDLLVVLLLVTVLAAVEEWAFRGVMWKACVQRFGALPALVVTSAAFGLLHLGAGPTARMPEQFVMGLILGAVRWKTGRLWPCIVAHVVANTLILSLGPE